MKFRSCFNIFEDGELLEAEELPLPIEDIDFWEEEVDFDYDETECCTKQQLQYQVSRQLSADINDIKIK